MATLLSLTDGTHQLGGLRMGVVGPSGVLRQTLLVESSGSGLFVVSSATTNGRGRGTDAHNHRAALVTFVASEIARDLAPLGMVP